MALISTLQEASGHDIASLKKVMQKDPRVKQIFQKALDVEDLENKVQFLATLKFFLLNNRNVIDFVEGRTYIKDMNKNSLKKFRELKPDDLTQAKLDELREFVADLFREHGTVEKSGISATARKALVDWANGNGRWFNLSKPIQQELLSVPGIRPDKKIVLYRGLLFSGSDLKERKRFDGQLEVGHGLKFLRSVRNGGRIVDLEWDRPSSWSTSREVAEKFARFSSAGSNFAATLQWLSREGKIDGDLGFIVSMLVDPKDVLIDMNRLQTAAHLQHGDEGEIIVAPGTYTCRVNTKYTKTGEVDPTASVKGDEKMTELASTVRDFATGWSHKVDADLQKGDWNSADADRALRRGDIELLKKLIAPGFKDKLIADTDELQTFYRDHIKGLTDDEVETAVAHADHGKVAAWISALRKEANTSIRHKDFVTKDNYRGDAKRGDAKGHHIRDSFNGWLSKDIKSIKYGVRFTDRGEGNVFDSLMRGFLNDTTSDWNRRSKVDQQKAIDRLIPAFFKQMGLTEPEDKDAAIQKMALALLTAERNARLVDNLSHARTELDKALGTIPDTDD
jgi:hypothetical protein